MIIAWKVVVKKVILFQDVSVLACYDYCVENNIEQKKNIKPIHDTE